MLSTKMLIDYILLRWTDFSNLELPVHLLRQTAFFLFLLLMPCNTSATSSGSNTAPSREVYTTYSGASNSINGFAGMYNGFALANNSASVTFNSCFPVGNTICLNGGIVTLSQDLFLDSGLIITTTGTFVGNNHTIEFAQHDQIISLPSLGPINKLTYTATGTNNALTLDWSPDGKYLAVGTIAQSSTGPELQIYAFNGLSLTLTASLHTGLTTVEVAWQRAVPSSYYYLVAATTSGLYAYQFTPTALSLHATSTITGINVAAVCWHPSGNSVAVSQYSPYAAGIYTFNAGALTFKTSYTLASSFQDTAIQFDPSGSYLAVGVHATQSFQVFSWNGTILNSVAISNYGANCESVCWTYNGSLIVVGTIGGPYRLSTWSFNRSTNSLSSSPIPSCSIGGLPYIFSVDIRPDGRVVACGDGESGGYVRIFALNPFEQQLTAVTSYLLSVVTVNQLKWSPNGQYLACADSSGNVTIFNFLPGTMNLQNTNLIFNSPVQLQGPLLFSGVCSIAGGGNTLNLNSQSITVATGSSLLFKNIVLEGITGTNLQCADSTGIISFENVSCLVNNTMQINQGQLAIIGDLSITGTGTFVYASNQTSTIFHGAQWYFDRGMTFSYFSQNGSNNLINFADSTAQLYLYETALYAQPTGLQLSKGTVTIDGQCPFYSYASTQTNGILIGDGLTNANNVNLIILPESGIDVGSSYVVYQNVN